jgi:hypothetical protein
VDLPKFTVLPDSKEKDREWFAVGPPNVRRRDGEADGESASKCRIDHRARGDLAACSGLHG